MNEKIIVAVVMAIALVGVAAIIGIYIPTPAHAKPQFCTNQGACFSSLQQCLKASPGNSPCKGG